MGVKGSVANGFNGPGLGIPAGQGFNLNESAKSNWLGLLLARAGFDMGAWMPYVTGGLAVANLGYQVSYWTTFLPLSR